MKNEVERSALMVDLYELTMAAGYFHHNYNPTVTFELFSRYLPENRNYLIVAGIEEAIEFIGNLSFSKDEIKYLKSLKVMKNVKPEFFEYLAKFSFSGNVYAVNEGEIIFANEPILQVQAPLIEAQILETYLLSVINLQTMIASKSSRIVNAANSDGKLRGVMEFGSRRAHGPEAGVYAARAAYIAGCVGTSNVLAGYKFGIPVYGTAAHSWTLAFDSELEAFKKYSEVFPDSSIYLIDTFDTLEGAKHATQTGFNFNGVRIDSGDLELQSKKVRKILDDNGFKNSKIILSGDLNEYKIDKLVKNKTPVDSFGVGTQLATSADAPSLPVVYKLVEVKKGNDRIFRAKTSPHKIMYPGRKQVFRVINNGRFEKDTVDLAEENKSVKGKKLLHQWMLNGKQVKDYPSLENIKTYVNENLKLLPRNLLDIYNKVEYKVEFSGRLNSLLKNIQRQHN